MTSRPTYNFLLLTRQQLPERTDGGIIIPEGSRQSSNEGTIVDMGPQAEDSGAFRVGDKVVFTAASEYKLLIDEVPYTLVDAVNVILHTPAA